MKFLQAEEERPRLLLVEAHPARSQRLALTLGSDHVVCGRLASVEPLSHAIERMHPSAVILGRDVPHRDALAAVGGRAPVVVTGRPEDPEALLDALDAGATGALADDSGPNELRKVIRGALEGRRVIAKNVALTLKPYLLSELKELADYAETPRQKEIIERLEEGADAKEVAQDLGVTRKTVEYHKYKVMSRVQGMDLDTLIELVLKRRRG